MNYVLILILFLAGCSLLPSKEQLKERRISLYSDNQTDITIAKKSGAKFGIYYQRKF